MSVSYPTIRTLITMHHVLLNQVLRVPVPVELLVPGERVVSVPVGDPGLVPVPVGEVLVLGLRVPSVGDLVRPR